MISYVWNAGTVLYICSTGCRLGPPCNRCNRFAFPRLASTIVKDSSVFPWKYGLGNPPKAWLTLVSCQCYQSHSTYYTFHSVRWQSNTISFPLSYKSACNVCCQLLDSIIWWGYAAQMVSINPAIKKVLSTYKVVLIPIYIGKGSSLVLTCLRTSDSPFSAINSVV